MTIATGARIGVYEITAIVGAGGMGEVYRARDSKLNRDVAIKVLPQMFALDPDRHARFEREAQVLAALNHPNIAAIYGTVDLPPEGGNDSAAGGTALVMELVEGEDLSAIIARGPLGITEALAIARQITDALDAAHGQGIIHRDLKPANIKIRPDGTVKILDFGLAKAVDPAGAVPAGLSMSPTFTSPAMTQMGTIVGTAAYMSPEQARGKAVDARADVWAFGVVLHEMLTGRPSFAGDTVSDLIAAVLTKEPDLSAVPTRCRRLINGCLEKDARRRVRDIADVWLLLDDDVQRTTPARGGRAWLWALPALVVGVAATWIALAATRPVASAVPIAFVEPPPPATQFTTAPIPSPDGRQLALIGADAAGKRRLWMRAIGEAAPHAIDGTDGVTIAFWSPDSRQIGFAAQGQIRRSPASGGPATLVVAATPLSAVWLTDGDILISVTGQGLLRAPASGGSLRPAAGLSSESMRSLQIDGLDVSPDGRLVLFNQFGGETGVYVARVDGSAKRLLYAGQQSAAVFAGADLIVHREANVLLAQRFDPAAMSLGGDAFPVAENASDFDVAAGASGALSFISGARQISTPTWFTRDGRTDGTAAADGEYTEVAISRGGRWLGFVRKDPADGNVDVWIQATAGGAPARLTSDPDIDHLFAISQDERDLVWEAHAGGKLNLMRRPIDGATPAQLVRPWGKAGGPADWSPDGRSVLYHSDDGPTGSNFWSVPIGGAGEPVRLTQPSSAVDWGQYSPDGRWLAFSGGATGHTELYVQRVEAGLLVGGPERISEDGGNYPLWRKDGAELFYLKGRTLMAVDFRGRDERPAGTPRALFTMALSASGSRGYGRKYAVSPDGQRFLAIVPAADQPAHPATVILNWRAGLSGR